MKDNTPERIYSLQELKLYDGETRDTKLVTHNGIVYDVTNCPKWRLALHENLHYPGQDLTSELVDAPHHVEVFNYPCVKVAGKLSSSQ